jgi:hypothetical protein
MYRFGVVVMSLGAVQADVMGSVVMCCLGLGVCLYL